MKKMLAGWALLLCLWSWGARAQSTEQDVSARLVGKPLLLRGFWMGDKLQFDSTGQPIADYKIGSFTESAFDAKAVKVHGDHLTIKGQRVALFFDKDGAAMRLPMRRSLMLPAKLSIVIDGKGNQDFSKELDAIFATSLSQIVPFLPDFWQPFAQKHLLPRTQTAAGEARSVAVKTENGRTFHIGGELQPPKVIHSVQPEFSDAARHLRFSGNVEVYLWVNIDGTPSHVTIVRPVGLGLDEKAVAAVSQYRFAPATLNGEPVKVDLYIDVNFQIF